MNDLVARTPRQLDISLRLLYSEGIRFTVTVEETEKGKIVYVIYMEASEQMANTLKEKYRILIS